MRWSDYVTSKINDDDDPRKNPFGRYTRPNRPLEGNSYPLSCCRSARWLFNDVRTWPKHSEWVSSTFGRVGPPPLPHRRPNWRWPEMDKEKKKRVDTAQDLHYTFHFNEGKNGQGEKRRTPFPLLLLLFCRPAAEEGSSNGRRDGPMDRSFKISIKRNRRQARHNPLSHKYIAVAREREEEEKASYVKPVKRYVLPPPPSLPALHHSRKI